MASHLAGQGARRPRSMKSCIEKAKARGVKDPRQFCRAKRK